MTSTSSPAWTLSRSRKTQPNQPRSESDEDDAPTFETWANVTKPAAFPYVAPAEGHTTIRLLGDHDDEFDSAGTRLVDAISSWPGAAPLPAEPEAQAAPVITEPDRIPAYLADGPPRHRRSQ